MNRLRGLRAVLTGIMQLSIGVLLVAGLTRLMLHSSPKAPLPPGWSVIRPPHEVSALAAQGEIIWAGGRDGLAAIDAKTVGLRPPHPGQPPMRYVRDLLVDSAGNLWIAHSGGLTSHAQSGEWKSFSRADGYCCGPALALLESRDATVWVGTETGVVRYDGNTWSRFSKGEGLGTVAVDVIFQDRGGVLWLGSSAPTEGGLSSYDGEVW